MQVECKFHQKKLIEKEQEMVFVSIIFIFFVALPGGRIQGWQRTACRDMRCRTAAEHMQCARSCRIGGALPVPAVPPSLRETLTYKIKAVTAQLVTILPYSLKTFTLHYLQKNRSGEQCSQIRSFVVQYVQKGR